MRVPLSPLGPAALLLTLSVAGCVHIRTSDVRLDAMQPRYARPTPAGRSAVPLVLLYDPRALPEELPLETISQIPQTQVRGTRSLVTRHLRSGLEAFFDQVSVETDANRVPPDAVVGAVEVVRLGLIVAPGGKSLIGTLEWSITLRRPGETKPFYSWAQQAVGTTEVVGAFGSLDPAPAVQGAVEAALRGLLADLAAKDVAGQASARSP